MKVRRHPEVAESKRGEAKSYAAGTDAEVTPETSTPVYPAPEQPQFRKRPGETLKMKNYNKRYGRRPSYGHRVLRGGSD